MDFATSLAFYQQRVESQLAQQLQQVPFPDNALTQAMHYGVLQGGKRLRPFLVYATGAMLGVPLTLLDVPAVAIEFIHAYSLIHDDLPAMDNDALRRGKPTCHIVYGEAIAILAGDALQSLAFETLSSAEMPDISSRQRLKMLAELAKASGIAGMCAGQALDLAAEGRAIPLAEMENIHRHKTGALIRAAVRLAVLLANAEGQALQPILDEYADAIGLAFQVQDDILDIVGDSLITGKTQGADIALQKSTYPSLLGLRAAQDKAKALHQQATTALDSLAELGLDTRVLQSLSSYIIERNK
jgi:farnesyl diphosphate synthase